MDAEDIMPIIPTGKEPTKWLICYSYNVDGSVMHVKEEFHGTVREAMLHEIWLRGLVRDSTDTYAVARGTC